MEKESSDEQYDSFQLEQQALLAQFLQKHSLTIEGLEAFLILWEERIIIEIPEAPLDD